MRAHSPIRVLVVLASAMSGCTLITGASNLEIVPDDDGALDGDRRPVPTGETDATAVPDVIGDHDASDAGSFCPGYATFCDDFESGDFTKWSALNETNGGKVTAVDTPVFAGKKAMHATAGPSTPINGNYPSVAAGARMSIPAVTTGGMLVVRARVFMPKILAAETTFLKAVAKGSVDDMNVKVASGGVFKVDTDTPDAGPELIATKGNPVAQWFCIEWQATIGIGGHQRLVLDGETILDVDENNFTLEGYDAVQVGFHAANGAVTQEQYFDDVVIATQPIGCP